MLATALLAALWPASVFAFEPLGVVWPAERMPLPYCINPAEGPVTWDGSPLVADDYFVYLVQRAFSMWENLPDSRISFAYAGICAFDPWNDHDGVNTVGWGWLWGGTVGAAHPSATHIAPSDGFGTIYEADIVLDVRVAQSYDDPTYYLNTLLPHVILHEVGHFLGLDHSDNPCAVMAPTGIVPGFCEDDTRGAAALYP